MTVGWRSGGLGFGSDDPADFSPGIVPPDLGTPPTARNPAAAKASAPAENAIAFFLPIMPGTSDKRYRLARNLLHGGCSSAVIMIAICGRQPEGWEFKAMSLRRQRTCIASAILADLSAPYRMRAMRPPTLGATESDRHGIAIAPMTTICR
ncbi:hypothetical protein [Sphingomonas natans]|uniref:hypothetical protein n=1 Tax=Sphingomonas natans TaxID=3063330 RepID=UPI0026E16042|nr:hypothetical protein [Sphingomonas sp. BIUV-7]